MNSKIIIIAVAVVCITGASFATGVAIEKHNSRETSMLVDEAVSSAVSDAFNSTTTIETIIVSTTEKSTVSEPAATTVQTTTEASTTKAKKNCTITKQKTEKVITGKVITGDSTAANTSTTNFTPSDGEGKRIKSSDGDYWKLKSNYFIELNWFSDGRLHVVYVDEDNNWFYFDDNGNRIYKQDWKH